MQTDETPRSEDELLAVLTAAILMAEEAGERSPARIRIRETWPEATGWRWMF